ncbi:hypothetical protein YTPLAS18_18160 [Nitrospira sp.]|nr:hypothetical protein YTPLAS18_18160 [Nitrospira sp.]
MVLGICIIPGIITMSAGYHATAARYELVVSLDYNLWDQGSTPGTYYRLDDGIKGRSDTSVR